MQQLLEEKNKNSVHIDHILKENEVILMNKIEEVEYGARL